MSFPSLPVLELLRERLGAALRPRLKETVFVCVQHLLETTGSLFQVLVELGARPDRIFILGKHYSSNGTVVAGLRSLGCHVSAGSPRHAPGDFERAIERQVSRLWKKGLAAAARYPSTRVLVLDDGGRCLLRVPSSLVSARRVVGVEQTTGGIWMVSGTGPGKVPIVSVASSATKQHLESPLISEAVLRRLHALTAMPGAEITCGVIGLGNIGRAVALELRLLGYRVVGYDIDPEPLPGGIERLGTIEALFQEAGVIFGCSGSDVTERAYPWLHRIRGEKLLISCSSEDREFRWLLRSAAGEGSSRENREPSAEIVIELNHARFRVLRGGFPVNFDGGPESVPMSDIQLTRGLLLGGIAQALICARSDATVKEPEMLHPSLQRAVAEAWFRSCPGRLSIYPPATLNGLSSGEWIRQRSGGSAVACEALHALLASGVAPA